MMTNHLSTPVFIILGIMALLGSVLPVHAEPMDSEAAKNIPELKKLFFCVRDKGRLTDQNRLVVEANIASDDPVLVSLAVCIVAESKGDETNLCAKVEDILNKSRAMPQAFIQLMLAKKKTEGKSMSERMAALETLLREPNPYLRVEAAKALLKNDPQKGEDALRTLLSDNSIIAKGEAFRQLHRIGKDANAVPVPMPDERYEFLLSIIENSNSVFQK